MRLTKIGQFEYGQLKGAGWTDEQMVAAGHFRPWQPSDMPPPAMGRGDVVTGEGQLELFKGCTYVQDIHMIMVPGVAAPLDQTRFDVRFGGREFRLSVTGGKAQTPSAWECFTKSQLVEFPKVDATYFDPREAVGRIKTVDGMTYLNTFAPLTVLMTPGDASPFINHVKKILPEGDDAQILICYLAACVQYPGVKAKWAPLLQGVEGNGKSIIASIMWEAIGARHVHAARAAKIDGRFNAHLFGKLLVVINEVKVTQDRAAIWETLKTLITEEDQEVEYKGGAVVMRKFCFNILFTTNHQDAITKTANDRRICPLFCAQQKKADLERDGMGKGHTSPYFIRLWDWLKKHDGYALVAHYLKHYPIPDDLNFTTKCLRAPETSATQRSIAAGFGIAEQEVMDAIEDGHDGFRGGWIASHALHKFMDASLNGRRVARNKRREMLEALGYVLHPGLPDGRCPTPVPGQQRPRLYIKPGHLTHSLRGVQVVGAYIAAQAAGAPE